MKKIFKIKNLIFVFVGIIIGTVGYVVADNIQSIMDANQVGFSSNKTNKTNIQEAVDELYDIAKTHCPDGYSCQKEYTFDYLDETSEIRYHTFTAPVAGKYKIELWGASGGHDNFVEGLLGGKGAYTSGIINLDETKPIYIYIGGVNGYNGGGLVLNTTDMHTINGGGATDVRLTPGNWDNNEGLNSRMMVAAGGGGTVVGRVGGAGGSLNGISAVKTVERPDICPYEGPSGGTQILGGTKGIGNTPAGTNQGLDGGFGFGGSSNGMYSAGGGGGYYGGGSSSYACNAHSGGSGGSSYISGYIGSIAITSKNSLNPRLDSNNNSCNNNTNDIVCSYHYSGYVFSVPIMKSGDESMPTHDGKDAMIGNLGNGYAKITYLGA